ncbi:hypothetical protein GCM10010149_18130 [Nonomuraea roseoviolacea subsp. roseoviolacea]
MRRIRGLSRWIGGFAGVVQTIEITQSGVEPWARVFLMGMDIFSVPVEQVISKLEACHNAENGGGIGLVVPELSVGMCYPTDPDQAGFSSVLIAGQGYDDPPPRDDVS